MIDRWILQVVIKKIVEQQQLIIGPLALEQANKIPGLKVSDGGNIKAEIKGNDDPGKILTLLVKQYKILFGRASIEVCKDAIKEVKPSIPPQELPEILR